MKYDEVIKIYQDILYLPDVGVLDAMFGTVFANMLPGDPIWVFLVAPPGSGKTVLLMSISDSRRCFSATTVTPQALISGATGPNGSDPSIIPQLDGKIFVIKDFTAVLNMHHTARDEVFGYLRDAYDGKIEKFFGNGIRRIFKSRFGILAGVTPAIEMVGSTNATLGERFLYYRFGIDLHADAGIHQIDQALKNALDGVDDNRTWRLAQLGAEVCNRTINMRTLPTVDEEYRERLKTMAGLVARLRASVSRDKYTGEVHYLPVPEVGTRLVKQLARLTHGICLWRGYSGTLEARDGVVWNTVAHIALGSIASRVEVIVKALFLATAPEGISVATISANTAIPSTTCQRVLEDLEVLRIARSRPVGRLGVPKGTAAPRNLWTLNRSIFKKMEFLKLYQADVAWRDAKL